MPPFWKGMLLPRDTITLPAGGLDENLFVYQTLADHGDLKKLALRMGILEHIWERLKPQSGRGEAVGFDAEETDALDELQHMMGQYGHRAKAGLVQGITATTSATPVHFLGAAAAKVATGAQALAQVTHLDTLGQAAASA